MSNTDENKPIGKPGQRNRKGEQRRQKSRQPQSPKPDQHLGPEPDQLQSPEPDRQPDAREQIDAAAAPADDTPTEAAASAPAGTVAVSLQTIATAYGDYTRRSLEETRSFVERLKVARSLDKVMEAQTEFARQAYETFVAESQKIRELHSELARQTLKPLQGLVSKNKGDAD